MSRMSGLTQLRRARVDQSSFFERHYFIDRTTDYSVNERKENDIGEASQSCGSIPHDCIIKYLRIYIENPFATQIQLIVN